MHGQEWSGEQDPTGWFISEKLDGYRAFWDGSQLFSKNGKVIPVPPDFISSFPRDVSLDGELWIGYESFGELSSIYRKTIHPDSQIVSDLWKNIKFCVFDAPKYIGNYLERHSFASNSISRCDQNICMIPTEQCLGLEHLQRTLHQITKKKGEGVMLYHPEAIYTSGRTNHLLKVKSYEEEDVKFLKINPNSYSFICEQKNGTQCIVKCSGWDYTFPPSHGTVLSVKHNGIFKRSHKMKHPFLTKVRTDLQWHQLL
eukprot:TRINITY_DN2528_c0_g6_i2.p1 TRINITY_DN2528_c0_g6~~TRINITY_DN2528_c0_g6_i2.p1  ORF type:complete len:256 (+),score=43.53 TRINITY_DN2528_c0_g6_i2:70-837(+)